MAFNKLGLLQVTNQSGSVAVPTLQSFFDLVDNGRVLNRSWTRNLGKKGLAKTSLGDGLALPRMGDGLRNS